MAILTLQDSYSSATFSMLPGQQLESFSPVRVTEGVAGSLLSAGRMAFKVPGLGAGLQSPISPGTVYQDVVGGVAADVDAILSGGASSASIQTILAANANGVMGDGPFQPPRNITLVLSNHADWNATTAVLTGVNADGVTVSENLAIPDTGNATVTSVNTYQSFTSLVIPAQGGTGGTFTIGVTAVSSGAITAPFFAGIVVRQPVKTVLNASAIYGYPGFTGPATYEADYVPGEVSPLLTKGAIAVVTETAFTTTDSVYVRITSGAGGSLLGTFRNTDDTSTALLISGARCVRNSAAGVTWMHFPDL
jgi:hypothetical protein